jgi:hypothetical protein
MAEVPILFSGTTFQRLAQESTTLDTGYGAGPELASLGGVKKRQRPHQAHCNGEIPTTIEPTTRQDAARRMSSLQEGTTPVPAKGLTSASVADASEQSGTKQKRKPSKNKFKPPPDDTGRCCEGESAVQEHLPPLTKVKARKLRQDDSSGAAVCVDASSVHGAHTAGNTATQEARHPASSGAECCNKVSGGNHHVCLNILLPANVLASYSNLSWPSLLHAGRFRHSYQSHFQNSLCGGWYALPTVSWAADHSQSIAKPSAYE